MILTNISKLLKKLKTPEPIIDIYYWQEIREMLVIELQNKKSYHAKKALTIEVPEQQGEILTKEEMRVFNRYQHHIQMANLFHVTIEIVNNLFDGTKDLYKDYLIEKHKSIIERSDTMHKMIVDLEKLYKEVDLWKRMWKSEASLYMNSLDISYKLAQRIKSISHDSKN